MPESTNNNRLSGFIRPILISKGVITAASVVLVYTIVGFFIAPYLVKHFVPQLVQKHLQRNIRIGDVRINPFLLIFEVDNVLLTETDGRTIAGFDALSVDLETSSLLRWAWTFRNVELVKPIVDIDFERDGTLNLARMVPQSDEPQEETGRKTLRIIFKKVMLRDGEIEVTDQRPSIPAKLKISPLNLELNDISTLPEHRGPFSLAAMLDDGTKLTWTGEVLLNPFRSTGSISFNNVKTATLHEFVRDSLNIDPPPGNLHLQTDYRVDFSTSDPQIILSGLGVRFSDLSLSLSGASQSLMTIGQAELLGGQFDLSSRQLVVERLTFDTGTARLATDGQGTLDWQRIIKSSPGTVPPETGSEKIQPARAAKTPWTLKVKHFQIGNMAVDYRDESVIPESVGRIGAIGVDLSVEAELGGGQPHLLAQNINVSIDKVDAGLADVPKPLINVDSLVLQDGAFDLRRRALTVSRIGFDGGTIVFDRDAQGEVGLLRLIAPSNRHTTQGRSEDVATKGDPWHFAVKTVEWSGLTVGISDRNLKPDGPIFTVAPLNVRLDGVDGNTPTGFDLDLTIQEGGRMTASGTFDPSGPSVKGDLDISKVALTSIQPFVDSVANLALHSGTFETRGKFLFSQKSTGADVNYDGGFIVADLKITELDSQDTLLGWKALRADRLIFNLQPQRFDIKELKLMQPVMKLIIHEDGTVNLAEVMKGSDPAAVSSQGEITGEDKKKDFLVNVKRMRIEDAELDFADLTLTPKFGTKIEKLSGVVAGLSSSANARAQVELAGKVDQYGQAKIGGEIDAFDPVTFTDITMIFRNIEMNDLTPYSGKFAGRRIDSGRLSLDLTYQIDKGKLLGEHKIIIEKIKLGQRVDSPVAKNLPLDLAIALMEDKDGVIDIGLPVRGDLNDPEFSYGNLIGQALVNLVTKVATAPFRALGLMIPGGKDNLDTVAFEPGSAVLSPPERENIRNLSEALKQRPQLMLEVQGRYSIETDGAAMKDLSVRRLLAAQLGTELVQGEKPDPVDFNSRETQEAIEEMFRERFGADELKKLAGSLEKEIESGAISKAKAATAKKEEDPGKLTKAIYTRLVENESIPKAAFDQLASARSQTVIEELTTKGSIAPERLRLRESSETPKGRPGSAKLFLQVGGKSS